METSWRIVRVGAIIREPRANSRWLALAPRDESPARRSTIPVADHGSFLSSSAMSLNHFISRMCGRRVIYGMTNKFNVTGNVYNQAIIATSCVDPVFLTTRYHAARNTTFDLSRNLSVPRLIQRTSNWLPNGISYLACKKLLDKRVRELTVETRSPIQMGQNNSFRCNRRIDSSMNSRAKKRNRIWMTGNIFSLENR